MTYGAAICAAAQHRCATTQRTEDVGDGDGSTAADRADSARIQPVGRQPDAGGLRAALHRQSGRGAGRRLRVANTALGGISFLALEAIGGTITMSYGFTNAVVAILLVSC